MHRGPLSKLKKEHEAKNITETKPAVVKTFVPKVTATLPKNDFKDSNKFDDVAENKKNNDATESVKLTIEDAVNGAQPVVPPKPLPRASRAGSICEPAEDGLPKPVARPRTNSCAPVVTSVNPNMPISGGYKVLKRFLMWAFFCRALFYVLCIFFF